MTMCSLLGTLWAGLIDVRFVFFSRSLFTFSCCGLHALLAFLLTLPHLIAIQSCTSSLPRNRRNESSLSHHVRSDTFYLYLVSFSIVYTSRWYITSHSWHRLVIESSDEVRSLCDIHVISGSAPESPAQIKNYPYFKTPTSLLLACSAFENTTWHYQTDFRPQNPGTHG